MVEGNVNCSTVEDFEMVASCRLKLVEADYNWNTLWAKWLKELDDAEEARSDLGQG